MEKTGVDTLAVGIGTAHGIYPSDVTPKIRIDILKEILSVVDVPLVLHGGSSNPDDQIAEAVKTGIAKVNISSDYKHAFFVQARKVLAEDDGWDPNNLFPTAIEAAKEGKNVNGPDKNCPVLPNAYGCHLNSRIIRSFISV